MKKVIIREGQEGIITGHIPLNETPGFKEKCEEIARLLGASVNTTLNGEICLTNEQMHVVLGIDQGDGSKFYGNLPSWLRAWDFRSLPVTHLPMSLQRLCSTGS